MSADLHDSTINAAALVDLKTEVLQKYEELTAQGLKLDLTRGKPSAEQLDLSHELLSLPGGDYTSPAGVDVRNYGGLDGVKELRALWADLLGLPVDNVIAGDASSLNIVFDLISWAYTFGTNDSERPWSHEETIRWICPVPGYDRHFSISELFGFEMITVPMLDDGPDMDAVRELVKDPLVKGMWLVPMFSNPTGATISEAKARELAELETAAPDFRIVWDNAYAVHILDPSTDATAAAFPRAINILDLADTAGNPNRFWYMSSTSKITFAGAGVAFFASSVENLDWYRSKANIRGIGPNKVNQLAHLHYFKDAQGVRELMVKHAQSLAPKFNAVLNILEERLGGLGAGVVLTAAGSTFPAKQDPQDQNLRLAPSMPPLEQVELAMDGFATCVLVAAIEKLEATEA